MYNNLPNNKKLRTNAQNLRRQATKWEKRLWYDYLKGYPVQFNRQKNIGDYIVDFYCKKAALVIELDGSYHRDDEVFKQDEIRTAVLSELGLTVMRFTNREIDEDFCHVCGKIDAMVQSLIGEKMESDL